MKILFVILAAAVILTTIYDEVQPRYWVTACAIDPVKGGYMAAEKKFRSKKKAYKYYKELKKQYPDASVHYIG